MKIDSDLDLVLERFVDLKPEQIWKVWTTPETYHEWFCPKPWTVSECRMDLKPGGEFSTTMMSPEGMAVPNTGCILEVIENKKLVWTDALLPGFRPSLAPVSGADMVFTFTAILILEPKDDGTKYTAIVKHSNVADKEKHEKMGFHEGWGTALDQLVALAKKPRVS